jgi:dihydrodipicolinate synthase/N-acetylneuraminate lyase
MTLTHKLWSRLFTFLPMPTANDGEAINEKILRKLIDYQIASDIDGFCVLGSTGGFGSFSDDEMKRAMEVAATDAKGRAPSLREPEHVQPLLASVSQHMLKKSDAMLY